MIKKITYKLKAVDTDSPYDSWWLIYEDINKASYLIYKDTVIVKTDIVNTDLTDTDLSEMTELQRLEIIDILSNQ